MLIIPDWINKDSWDGYCEMRKLIKKPMTQRAKQMAIKKLEGYKKQGYDPNQILEESEFYSYQGLFPPKNVHTIKDNIISNIDKPPARPGESWDEYNARLRSIIETKRQH